APIAKFKRDEDQDVSQSGEAVGHQDVLEIRPPFGDMGLHKVTKCFDDADVNMPAEWIDEGRRKASDAGETEIFEIHPVPAEQRHAAKQADDQETHHEAAVQVGPKDHEWRQQTALL